MAQETYKGDVLQRIGGIGLILGSILTIVANVIFPRPEDPSQVASYVKMLTEHPDRVRLASLGLLLGLWALVPGFAAVYRSITSGAGSAWARLGYYGVIAATAVFSVAIGIDVAAAKAAGAGAPAVATPIAAVGDAVFGVSVLAYWMSLVILGIGVAWSTVYPKWIGWIMIVASVVAAVAGSTRLLMDASTTSEMVFGAGALVTSVMALVLGVIVTRREMKAMKA